MATDKTPEPKADELPPLHVRVKVRAKGDGKISRGDRNPAFQHKDLCYEEGDVIVLHRDNARELAARDFVDIVK